MEDGITNVSGITAEVLKVAVELKEPRGFREVWVVNPDSESEGTCLFLRDAVAVFKWQFEQASDEKDNFHFEAWRAASHTTGEPMWTQSMSGDLVHEV